MGIETLTAIGVALGATGTTATVVGGVVAAGAAYATSQALKPKMPNMGQQQQQVGPTIQASKSPLAPGYRRANTMAETGPGSSGIGTLLTGAGGIDPSALMLGKGTLLGGG